MSSSNTPTPPGTSNTTTPPASIPPAPGDGVPPRRELIIYGHSMLFYWWPIWFFGFLFALLTWWSDQRMAIVPPQSEYEESQVGDVKKGRINIKNNRGEETTLDRAVSTIVNDRFYERVSPHTSIGILYVFILVITILITTVPLRGIASLAAIVTIALIVVTISYLGGWDEILNALGRLRVHMSLGYYLFSSCVLLVVWLIVFLVYDRMNYWRVTPGQIAHRMVFGGGERTYDTEGMAFTKLRDDLFRHLILGLGSGDLLMDPLKAGGADRAELSLHNVLFVGHKLQRIDDLISQKPSI